MEWLLPFFLIAIKFYASNAASCDTKFSDAGFNRDFSSTASSETTKNKASEIFTVGWCSNSQENSPQIEIDFKQSFGISGIVVGGPTNRDDTPYPTSVLVKYVPNGGDVNNFVNLPIHGGKLEISMSQPGSVQTNFGQAIAVRKLQFTIQSSHGDPCLKIDLVGCTLNDVCPGGCLNNGICVMQNTCQCETGYIGNNCELKECKPENLGLSTGLISADNITVSSQDPVYNKGELGNSDSYKGWCPALDDDHPWVEIKLDQPKAVSVVRFMWSNKGNKEIMTEFELKYVSAIDSSRQLRTFAKEIPAQNSTHIFTVTISPSVITDTIRITSSSWINRACFKLELQGCDPTSLCSNGWCLNGGICMGENICLCARGFVGNRCSIQENEIQMTNLTFVRMGHTYIATSNSIQFIVHGNVHLNKTDNNQILTINGSNSCIELNRASLIPSCLTDVNLCTNGFTFTLDLKFDTLLDDTPILSSGGQLAYHSGVSLIYSHNHLTYTVSTVTKNWTMIVRYEPKLHKWNHFVLSWSEQLGLEVQANGQVLGSLSRPTSHPDATRTENLSIGCTYTLPSVDKTLQVTNFNMWPLESVYLVNSGVVLNPVSTVMPIPTSSPATIFTSSAISSTTSSKVYTLDDSINAQCTSYRWNISLDLHILQLIYSGIKPSDIYMSSEKCKGTVRDNKLWFEQNFNTCRTSEQITEGRKLYSNMLIYATFDPQDPSILMQHIWTFKLACYVSTGETISSHLSHEVDIHSKNITAHHDIALTFYKDQNFLQRIQGNPLRITVGDDVYVKVSTSIPDWNTKLRLHTCYARSTDAAATEHLLISDGCEVDKHTHIISQSTHETKFVFRDFEYLTLNEGLDIFCNATFCDTSDFSSVCTQACRQGPPIVG